jgi:hypothetical protein
MLDSEKMAIAAHLHVQLRRIVGRVTDVEWMVRNREYAQEVVRVARAEAKPELSAWADKLEAALQLPGRAPAPAAPAPKNAPAQSAATPSTLPLLGTDPAGRSSRFGFESTRPPEGPPVEPEKRYVGRLR